MFRITDTSSGFRVQMSSRLDLIDRADELLAQRLLSDTSNLDAFAVRILLREALLNAVLHGGRQGEDSPIDLDVAFDADGLTLTVADRGPGFDWRRRLDRLDVLADGGRGIPLMGIYADEMQYDSGGNRLTLRKRANGAGAKTLQRT
ncbi:MAG: ATP-binding protein [Phycisphaerales bacterium]|nr:ATP-binding protein [Phycisphaerales bacterium]